MAKVLGFILAPFLILVLRLSGFRYLKKFTYSRYFKIYPDLNNQSRENPPSQGKLIWVQIEGFVVITTFMVLNYLPQFVVSAFSSLMGWVLYPFLSSFKKIIYQNLTIAFKDKYSEAEKKSLVFRSFQHSIDSLIWLLYISKLTQEKVLREAQVSGYQQVEDALKKKHGLILCAPHYSRFLFPAFYCSLGKAIPTNGIIRRMDNPLIREVAFLILNNLGLQVIPRSHWALKHSIAALKRNEIVFLLMDQNVAVGGIFVPFFGVPASTFRGVSYIYEKTGCEIMCCHGSYYRGRYELNYSLPLSDEVKQDELTTLREIHAYYEAALSERPYQHLWMHPRWKKRLPGEPSMYPQVKKLAKL